MSRRGLDRGGATGRPRWRSPLLVDPTRSFHAPRASDSEPDEKLASLRLVYDPSINCPGNRVRYRCSSAGGCGGPRRLAEDGLRGGNRAHGGANLLTAASDVAYNRWQPEEGTSKRAFGVPREFRGRHSARNRPLSNWPGGDREHIQSTQCGFLCCGHRGPVWPWRGVRATHNRVCFQRHKHDGIRHRGARLHLLANGTTERERQAANSKSRDSRS